MRVAALVPASIRTRGGPIFGWDEEAMAIVKHIENALIPLDLDCQGEFISLTNAIEMQLESGLPVPDLVHQLGQAILTLARQRALLTIPKTTSPDSYQH